MSGHGGTIDTSILKKKHQPLRSFMAAARYGAYNGAYTGTQEATPPGGAKRSGGTASGPAV